MAAGAATVSSLCITIAQAEETVKTEEASKKSWLSWLGLGDSPKPALSPTEWRPLKLWSREQVSPNTVLLRFAFDDYLAVAGMEVASCLLTRAFIGAEKEDGTRRPVIRPYTPSHVTAGFLEMVVKVYPEGKMSKHIGDLKVGETLDFKGPIMKLAITPNEFESVGLVAGGTGITPMLQVAERILEDPLDKTKVTLVFANVSESDILLKPKIDEMALKHPDQFSVTYVLDKPPADWSGSSGYITKELLAEKLPPPSALAKVLICGPPPMVEMIAGKPKGREQGELAGQLLELGYTAEQVFKF